LISDTQLYDNTPIRQDLINKYLLQKAKLGLNNPFLCNEKVNSLYVKNQFLCVDMLLPKYFVKLRYDFFMKEGFFTLDDFYGKKVVNFKLMDDLGVHRKSSGTNFEKPFTINKNLYLEWENTIAIRELYIEGGRYDLVRSDIG